MKTEHNISDSIDTLDNESKCITLSSIGTIEKDNRYIINWSLDIV